jgi:tRNA pseudouridine13 synthase
MSTETSRLARWRPFALHPPRALGAPCGAAVLRTVPEDFIVEEVLGFEPDGGGAHRLLWVEKSGANTLFVGRSLARMAGVRPDDVGFAGLKDRHALTRQWFSVPATAAVPGAGCAGEGFRVLRVAAHSRKLRRGWLAGNRFVLRLRGFDGDVQALARRVQLIAARGVPNYFGAQRFGRDAANLEAVDAWLAGAGLPRGRDARGFLFSAARSLLFNEVLAARVGDDSWDRLLPGELVNLDGSGSFFAAADIDAALEARLAAGDVHPTGPLPGTDAAEPSARALAVEAAALAADGDLVAQLAAAGVEAGRRALRLRPTDLVLHLEDADPVLSFGLPRGAYATTLLHEMIEMCGTIAEEA